jgi:predicted AlkP superfamily phosphohydrolase/phosphomutase
VSSRPTLLLGLDGASFSVLEPLWRRGDMPFLAGLVDGGVRAELQALPPWLTAPSWTSLFTGRSSGHHGIFDFVRISRAAGGMQYRMATSSDVQSETVWSMASRHGRRVVSLNFAVTFPPKPINGVTIPGFVPWRHLRRAVHPPEFYRELTALPGFDARALVLDLELERRAIQVLDGDEYEDWIQFHITREERWLEVIEHLFAGEAFDLLSVCLDGGDKLGHLCWRFIDPSRDVGVENAWERRTRDLCLQYYRRLDEILARIVELAGAEARVLVASDHGFGPTDELFYVNTWLEQHGWLEWAPGVPFDKEGKLVMLESTRSAAALFDWSRTLACALTSGSNGVYIATSGGAGQPGVPQDEYVRVRDEIAGGLRSWRDPATGTPVVRRVLTREEAFPGPCMEDAPDLTLELRDGGFVSILRSTSPVRPRPEVMGTHRPNGIFIGSGPGLKRSATVPSLSILDMAPLLLYSLDLPIPAELEGRLAVELFEDGVLDAEPPTEEREGARAHPAVAAPVLDDGGPGLDPADERLIIDRLAALGYLEA